MTMNLFGVGAAGNKAAIAAIENNVIAEENVKLVNTTVKDIPEKYKMGKDLVVQFSSMLGGCGKEPAKGAKAITDAILGNKINFSEMVTEDCREIVIVASTEGGTGCGAAPVIAQYFSTMNLPVHVFALIGFQDESRGLNNTLRFFKNLNDNVILHTIMNDQFLDYTGNYTKAEEAANMEFVRQLRILTGSDMIPSSQNIDDTDMYKVTTTSGYMDIKSISMAGVKNLDTFNDAIIKAFENGNCLEYDKSCKRLAVIVNASERVQDAVDSKLEVIKRYTGEPFEIFRHIQNDGGDEYVNIIVSGMNFPEKGIVDISKKYTSLKQNLNKEVKGFSAIYENIDLDEDSEFDMDLKQKNDNVGSMFANMVKAQAGKVNNVVVKPSKDENSEY
jgi:cell division GTPase FtsZ